jgi:hypothetical protein
MPHKFVYMLCCYSLFTEFKKQESKLGEGGGDASNGITFIPSFIKLLHNIHKVDGMVILEATFFKESGKITNKHETCTTYSLGKWNKVKLIYIVPALLMKQERCFITRLYYMVCFFKLILRKLT